MTKSKAVASAFNNGYLKTLTSESELKSCLKTFLEKAQNPSAPQEIIILNSPNAGIKVSRDHSGKFTTQKVNF